MNAETLRSMPWMGVVVPGGWLDGVLRRASNPRKHRWNCYLRACKRIPVGSPVRGSTSFDKINSRRHDLIDKDFAVGGGLTAAEEAEEKALDACVEGWLDGPLVCQNFVLGRYLRRLEKTIAAKGTTSPISRLDGTA